MARYADAEKFEKRLMELFMEPRYMHDEDNYYTAMSIAIDEIRHAPTADVAPTSEVAREIIEEIEKAIHDCKSLSNVLYHVSRKIEELKKKYTEVSK